MFQKKNPSEEVNLDQRIKDNAAIIKRSGQVQKLVANVPNSLIHSQYVPIIANPTSN